MNRDKTCRYIISLIRALIGNTQPEKKPDDISFEDIYIMAKKHHVRNMCFYALEKLDEKPEEELYEKWKQHTFVSEAQSAVQLAERDLVIKALQNQGIDCLPLKGCFLKEMYPKPEYREISDLDILIRPEEEQHVQSVMAANGYFIKENREISAHCVFSKPPFMTVEMHRRLFSDAFIDKCQLNNRELLFPGNPWEHVLPTDQPHIYALSPEDNYIFLILHLAKHYYGSGVGIRQFIDIWVYSQRNRINKDYVYSAFKETRMKDFYMNAEKLVNTWLSCGELDPELVKMEEFVFSSGVFGNFENKIINRVKVYQSENQYVSNSYGYVLRRAFPPLKSLLSYYPYLRKYPFMLPCAWVHRLTVKTFGKGSPAFKELKSYLKIRKESSTGSETADEHDG